MNDDDDDGVRGSDFALGNNSLGDTFNSTHSVGDCTQMPSFLDQTGVEPSMLAGSNLVTQPKMVRCVCVCVCVFVHACATATVKCGCPCLCM